MIPLVNITTKTQARKCLTDGNNKLAKHIMIFNLPATQQVCGRICKGCYAIKAQKMYPNVMPSRQAKLDLSMDAMFEPTVLGSIDKLGHKHVRIHESGDFYSQSYVRSWESIATKRPDVMFLAYTKRMNDFDFSGLRALPNVIVINSLFGKSLNYGPLTKAPANATICPAYQKDVKGCGHDCNICYDLGNKAKLEKDGIYFQIH